MGNKHPGGPKTQNPKPTLLAGRPQRPAGLDTEAAQHWEELVGLLEQAGILSLLDADLLGVYIDTWQRYQYAKRMASGLELVVVGDKGPCVSPWYKIMKESMQELRNLADRCGLTPASRSRLRHIQPPAQPGDEKWAGFGVVSEKHG